MGYIDIDYYRNTFNGTPIADDATLNKYIELASEDVDTATFNRIVDKGFNNLTTFQQDKIKKATAHQVETINTYGDLSENVGIGGYRLGDLSVDSGSTTNDISSRMSNRTLDLLNKTGLTNRNVPYSTGIDLAYVVS